MRRARLGALRMDMEELSTDIAVNGIVDHLVVDLSRKVPVLSARVLTRIMMRQKRAALS